MRCIELKILLNPGNGQQTTTQYYTPISLFPLVSLSENVFFFSALNLGLFIPRIILELVFIEFRPEEMATAT